MTGRGVSLEIAKTASKADVFGDAYIGGGKLSLEIGMVPLTVTTKNSLGGDSSDTSDETLSSHTYEVQATSNPKSQRGSWTGPNPVMKQLGATVKVDWSLTRE